MTSNYLKTIKPETAGFSSHRLQRVDNLLNSYIDSKKLPGAIALIAKRDEIVHFQCYGQMNIASSHAMRKDAIFRIYSMTKPITSVALMMLYEQGHFQLDDPVAKYIPAFKNLEVYLDGDVNNYRTCKLTRPMLIIDLLTHTSGFTYQFETTSTVAEIYRSRGIYGLQFDFTLDELIKKLADVPLLFSPGTHWNYGLSTDIVAYLVQIFSGCSFEDYLRKNIFQPLNMCDTDFYVPQEKIERFTANHSHQSLLELPIMRYLNFTPEKIPDSEFVIVDDPKHGYFTKSPKFISGGGGLVSTVNDYFNFCQMLLNRGNFAGHQLLSPKTLDLMTTNHLPGDVASYLVPGFSEIVPAGAGFGLGFSMMLDLTKAKILGTPGEYNWAGFASTMFFIDPKEELIVILLSQLVPSSAYPVRREFRVAVYQSLI